MKRIFLTAIALIFASRFSPAQFGHVYGYADGQEEGYGIELTSDGGFVVGGRTNAASITHGDLDYWVVRFDKTGKKLWDKAVGTDKFDNLW